MKTKVLFAWSGGKDSAMALHEIRRNPDYEVVALLTTVTRDYDRISMHGVQRALLEQQAASIGLPLEIVWISVGASNDDYESAMREILEKYAADGVAAVAFGDIFLEDLKHYREEKLAQVGMKGVFPIWKRDTNELAHTFIDLGFKSIVVCVDSQVLDGSFSGRLYDNQLLLDLPENIDPCGENGEFHSFVYDGPIFTEPIELSIGQVVVREERFHYCDVSPLDSHDRLQHSASAAVGSPSSLR